MPDNIFLKILLVVLLATASARASDVLSDPTKPYSAREMIARSAPRFNVNAIIVSADRRVAIVNGIRVGVGDDIDGATVIAIDKNELVLSIDGGEQTLRLRGKASGQ